MVKNKNIVITGVTGGVGSAIAKFFVKNKFNVIGVSSNLKKLNLLQQEINNPNFQFYQLDISNFQQVESVFGKIERIDYLINNASIFKTKKLVDFSCQEIDQIIDVNLKGTIYCTLQGLPRMSAGGRIINIGSVSGLHGIENQAVYSASKFGLNGFSDSLNQELIKQKIKITTISPGGINTPLWNENNPYQGKIDELLMPNDIVNTIEYIINLPDHVVLKNLTIFPACEWH